jgi:hypothetical protein
VLLLSVSGEDHIFKPLILIMLLVRMTAPIKINAFDDERRLPQITCDEWILLEKYRRGSQLNGWSHNDKITLTHALGKANSYPRVTARSGAKLILT